ncbi:MAG: hypothetical protein K2Y35_06780 [Burkholderiales bacterium]|nr:hypothetical protein [Burkholderiales bacterium]
MTLDPILQLTAALTLALVFGLGAIGKFAAWAELEGVVANFRVLPRALVPAVTRTLPPLELLLAVGVLIPVTREAAGLGMAILLAVFAAAIAVNVARGRVDIDCGCFRSALRQNLSWWLVLRNALLLVLALACLADPGSRELAWADNFIVVMAALTLVTAYLSVGYVTLKTPPTFEDNYQRSLSRRG